MFMEEIKETEKVLNPITETSSIIDKADAVAKRMEEANKRAEELLTRQEAIAARMMLSGKSEAGMPHKTAEQIEKEKLDEEVAQSMKKFGYSR